MAENPLQIYNEVEEIHVSKAALDLVTDRVAKAISEIPPEISVLTIDDLSKRFKVQPRDEMIRRNFWEEYDRAIAENAPVMDISKIYNLVCSRNFFYTHYLTNPYRVAYMLHEVERIKPKLKRFIHKGIDRLEEVIEKANLLYDNGHMDARAVKTLFDIVEFMYTRVYGSVVQKQEVKSLNVNLEQKVASATPSTAARLEDLREKLHSVEATKIISSVTESDED